MNKAEKQVYEKTFELFNGLCAICGNNQINMHHIRYGTLRGGRQTYMGNVIPLCKKHHDLVHTNKKKYMPILIDMINKKMEDL
jgi:predicted restriction endonuclease